MSQEKRTKLNAQISEEAAEWLVEFRLGEIDATGRREFDTWIRTSPEHLRAYLETAAVWNEGASLSAHRGLDSDALIALAGAEGNVVPLDLERAQHPYQAPNNRPPPDLSEGGISQEETHEASGDGPSSMTAENGKSPREPSLPPGKRLLPQRRISPRWLVSLAAALAIVVVGGTAVLLWQLGRDAIYATAVGERRILRLEDGSSVELNSRSRIRVRFSQNQRNVELLEGQVLFHVAKDTHRPFVVRSDQLRVRAVGTQFDVNRKTTGTTVTVVEGRVAVYRAGSPEPGATTAYASPPGKSAAGSQPKQAAAGLVARSARLAPPEESVNPPNSVPGADVTGAAGSAAIFLSAGDQLTVSDQTPRPRPQHASPTVATAWTQGQLVLDSATLADVAEEFNRYSVRRLVIEDHGEPPLRLSGVFATDPDFLLHYLRQRPDITVQETPTEVRIIRHE
jgi:ferric-dicitrate binding protein FerR (iron transport regulator)